MSEEQEANEPQLFNLKVKKEEPNDFEADAFLSLLRDDQILMGGFDLDEAIAETNGQSKPTGDGAVARDELLMKLEMEGEEPVSDAEGEEKEDEDNEWPPRDPNVKKEKGLSVEATTRRMMARVEKMGKLAEEKTKGRDDVAVTSSRLNAGRSFNVNDWSSEELRELVDGVKKKGTSKPALVRLLNHSEYMSKTRSIQDVYDKIADIRAMNNEHRSDAIREEKLDSHGRGLVRFQAMGTLAFIWSQQMQKLQNSRSFSRRHEFIKDQLSNFFTERVRASKEVEETPIEKATGGPARPIRWTRLYRIVRFVFSSSARIRDLPARIGINAMEAAVLMLIMSDVQKQARANLTDRTRAEHGSLFLHLARQDYRLFELDMPVADYAKPFLDPLRLREWRAVATEEAPDEAETYNQVFHKDDPTTTGKGKKRVRVQEDLLAELAPKKTFSKLVGEDEED